MKFKQFIAALFISAAAFAGGGWMYSHYEHPNPLTANNTRNSPFFKTANYTDAASSVPTTDFESAAAKASPAVVHIKVLKRMENQGFDFFGFPSDNQGQGSGDMSYKNNSNSPQEVASGSGVLVSANGYIVTNNHVVKNADELLVTLNDKNDYKAKVIGTDPSSDLAVIKIEGNHFPYLNFANSDNVRVGQWILAIGYPLDLQLTVTSGIVSAKARDIDINSSAPLESFIQTDAAVNPGNSGGALVNTDGDLIGINSAIASPTGSFAGYSYAIPSNIVARVAGDIIKYGTAKRAYLGIMFGSDQMSDADRQKYNIPNGNGVYVMEVANGSAADEAGIHKGDFITKLNGIVINSGTELVGKISALRPGDKVDITYTRDGEENTTTATLKGSAGNYSQMQQQMQQQQQQQPGGDQ